MMEALDKNGELGFRYGRHKNGEVTVTRAGRPVATLRGRQAERFRDLGSHADDSAIQQALARLTGNYKRGNKNATRRR